VSEAWEISAGRPGPFAAAAEVWRYRRLLHFIADRMLRRMYRRTILGWLWLFINPLFPIALRVIIFGLLLGAASEGLPYFLFLLGGTILWEAFSMTLMRGTRALELNRDLAEMVYHPRVLLPFGSISPALLDLAIKVAVFAVAIAFYLARDGQLYIRFDNGLLWAGAALGVALLFAMALALFTSVWGENARDARFATGQLLSVWYLLTPVLYPLSQVDPEHRQWMLLNPLTILVETFKWGIFGIGALDTTMFARVTGAVVVLFVAGLAYFARAEARTIDER
jgi:lipopolysaccharide transport system permease protein